MDELEVFEEYDVSEALRTLGRWLDHHSSFKDEWMMLYHMNEKIRASFIASDLADFKKLCSRMGPFEKIDDSYRIVARQEVSHQVQIQVEVAKSQSCEPKEKEIVTIPAQEARPERTEERVTEWECPESWIS